MAAFGKPAQIISVTSRSASVSLAARPRRRENQIDAIESALPEVDGHVGKALEPIRACAQLLTTIPRVSDIVANVIVAEIGIDMSRFPTPGHLISWAGLCPRNDESAGKRRSTRTRKSGTLLKTNLVTAAWSAVRVKATYLRAQFLRIKSRRGAKKAVMAVAASMLQAAFFMLRDGVRCRNTIDKNQRGIASLVRVDEGLYE
jgi:transposase